MLTYAPSSTKLINQLINCNKIELYHCSHFEKIIPKALFKSIFLKKNKILKAKAQAYIFSQISLEPIKKELFNNPYTELISKLSSKLCNQLQLTLGTIYMINFVKTIIKQVEKKILIETLSKNIYEYAMYVGNLYSPVLNIIQINIQNENYNLSESIIYTGSYLLEYLFSGQPKALQQRLMYKMPSTYKLKFEQKVDEQKQKHLFSITKRIVNDLIKF